MRAVSLSALPPHFARVGASRLVRFGVGLAAAAIAASVAVSACARTRPPRYPELLSLADALDREPARTLGRAALLLATLALACAGLARKLELDLRRAQVPRKEAPVGEFPAPHDDALLPERVATLAHAAASLAAPCALVTSDRAAFFALSLVTRLFAELSACLHAHVDRVLGNTCDADATRARAPRSPSPPSRASSPPRSPARWRRRLARTTRGTTTTKKNTASRTIPPRSPRRRWSWRAF